MLRAIDPLIVLRKKLKSSDDDDDDDDDDVPALTNAESLFSRLYSHEILSSCLDLGGKFCTSYITNSSSVLFTPGTNMRLRFDKVSSRDQTNRIYLDGELAGKKRELNTRSFMAFTLEILVAIERGVFFEGQITKGGKICRSPPAGRVFRPVGFCD